jgi:hypothetical protein
VSSPCHFLELCERDFHGPPLDAAEQEQFSEHLSAGCPTCEARIEEQLTGSDAGPLAEGIRELDAKLEGAVAFAGDAMAGGQLAVLARVQDRISSEDRDRRRRLRRRHQRILFYVVNLVAVVLICVAYLGTLMASRVQRAAAASLATTNELKALAGALARYVRDHPEDPPQTLDAFIAALRQTRPDGRGPYYPFDPERLDGSSYLDGFSEPYRYEAIRKRALIYSAGPNRRDELGSQDDLSRQVLFLHE